MKIEITFEKRQNSFGGYHKSYDKSTRPTLRQIESELLPHFEWMRALESLSFINLGPYGGATAHSILLDALCRFLFPILEENVKPTLLPHRCIWLQDFELEIWPHNALDYADPEFLQSYRIKDLDGEIQNDFQSFHKLVQLDGMVGVQLCDSLLPDLKKLTYFTTSSYDDEEVKMNQKSF